jgi:hypothetical protein
MGLCGWVILPYHAWFMGSNTALPPPQPPQPPAALPPAAPPSAQVARSDAEDHYTSLLAYFKHLVWLTGGALGVVILVAGYLFHSNLQDSLRIVRQDAKGEATRVATEESEKAVKTAFDEKNVKELIEKVAKEKVGAVTDTIIERQLTSKLQPIEQRIVLIGRISEYRPQEARHLQDVSGRRSVAFHQERAVRR